VHITNNSSPATAAGMMQLAMDRAAEPIILVRSDGSFLYANDAACAMLGYRRQELLKMNSWDVELYGSLEYWADNWQSLKHQGSLAFESVYRGKDGREISVYVTSKYLEFQSIEYSCVIAHDIQTQKRTETKLLEANEEIEQINQQLEASIERANLIAQEATVGNQAKSTFLAEMSHDIRTPMNAIIGLSDILAQEKLTPDQLSYVEIIRQAGNSLLLLLNDILDLSRIESGKLQVRPAECSLAELIESVATLMHPTATKKGLEFLVSAETPLPERIKTDPTRVRQCLINLTNNAIKFTEKGRVHIKIYLETPDKSFLRFDVVDTGPGIPPDEQHKIFNKFSQLESKQQIIGTGLGLAITRELAELLEGSVSLQSEPGRGSTFSLRIPTNICKGHLPAKTLFQSNAGSRKKPVIKSANKQIKQYQGRVLVADDNESNRILMKLLLKKVGLDPTLVHDGAEAVDQATHQQYDLILMDMRMPRMDGYEAVRLLRTRQIKTPIVALTGNVMKGEEENCLEIGCDAYMPKPIDRIRFYQMLDQYLEPAEKITTN